MKQVITLLVAAFIFTASFAEVKPATAPVKVNTASTTIKVSLQVGGKVSIQWNVVEETATTAYQIQKSINGGQFKTVAYLMGETNASYSFRDKVTNVTGNVEYRVITTDNNLVVNTVSQKLVIL